MHRRQQELDTRGQRERLEQLVSQRTEALEHAIARLANMEQELWDSRAETIHRLALAAECRDNATARHLERMSQYCALLAHRYGLDPAHCELILIASPMHDIGKIATPDHILLKPGRFTSDEYKAIMLHPDVGYRILSGSNAELLRLAATIAWTHHERFDGSDYARGLFREDIPLEGRFAAIADAFDASTSQGVYKPAYPIEQAIDVLAARRGSDFDPELLDLFIGAMDEVLEIRNRHADR